MTAMGQGGRQDGRDSGRTGRRAVARDPSATRWAMLVIALSLIVALPLLTLVYLALDTRIDAWPHLFRTVLPAAARDTVLLMLGTGAITLIIGTASAWLVTMCRFWGRPILEWLLLLPLAMPTYIIAYCYDELLDYTGPVQSGLRAAFGWQSMADYSFPEIRSLGGAIFVMSAVLYPYVYLTARSSFLAQSVAVLDVARTLGHGPFNCFRTVALPLARPALAAGVTLVLMESLNDIGAVEYFGVNTLTAAIYATWLGRGNLAGAAQMSVMLLVLVFLLIWLERYGRRQQAFHNTTGKFHPLPAYTLSGWRQICAIAVCLAPVLIGFAAPGYVLLENAAQRFDANLELSYLKLARNSLLLSGGAAFLAVVAGMLLVYARRLTRSRLVHGLTRFASIGYAVPGTVLAIGMLVSLSAIDNALDGWMRQMFGVSMGLMLSGSIFAIMATYTVRFLAVSHGAIDAGLGRISPHLGMAARALGRSTGRTMASVELPLIRPALVAAALLVFVDGMKELPATILLRPFNFDTLATHVYSYASLERFEDASLAALTIVLAGLVPVLILNRAAHLAFRVRP